MILPRKYLLFKVLLKDSNQSQSYVTAAYYLQQCSPDEQYFNECLRDSGNKLIHYLRQGIPELNIYEVMTILI